MAEASREAWMDAAKGCPCATYFHTPYWYELIAPKRNSGALSVHFDDGASAVVPFAKIGRAGGLLVDHFSSPGGTYGGWLSASILTPEHVKHLFRVLMSKTNLTFRVNPFDPSSRFIGAAGGMDGGLDSIGNTGGINRKDDFTHILDLTKGERAITLGMSKGHKSAIKSAERAGVTVRAAEAPREWDQYYELYRCSLERWRGGGPAMNPRNVYPRSLFRRIREIRTGNETLWLAFKEGVPIAGAVFFYWNGHAVSWHGAASSRYFDARPNNLLYWKIILDAISRGYKTFDFNPSGGYGGVESFKKHFGAGALPTPVISTKTPLRSLVSTVRRALKGGGRR
ncbi:MAG: GNAT family N-acetyltransferase [Chitinispirillales bacterium]|nr:GNAT family N-acetyltransferase [Chitinispirillales bacterium]